MEIIQGDIFINPSGRTIKIKSVNSLNTKVIYTQDGSYLEKTDNVSFIISTLEHDGYVKIPLSSGFFIDQNPPKDKQNPHACVGRKTISVGPEAYMAEIIKNENSTVTVQFSNSVLVDCYGDKYDSTIYQYEVNDFDIRTIFTPELVAELSNKFNVNVFEVIGVSKNASDIKFTVIGKSINKELLDKIEKSYTGAKIYQIKRLTTIDLK